MAAYLNPGAEEFARICASEYVDKTGLIHVLNPLLHTTRGLVLVSRARRFGKSFAAAMLCAYYGYGCDSLPLFQDREIGRLDPSFAHMGKYDILYIDLSRFKADALEKQRQLNEQAQKKGIEKQTLDWIDFLKKELIGEIRKTYGRKGVSYNFFTTLENTVKKTGRKFLWVCDEWDLFFREDIPDSDAAGNYLEMMRRLFKTSDGYTGRVFAGAYLTGIMPMKKMQGESAVSSFDNYTMLDPGAFAPYTGFTSEEVQELCHRHGISFEKMADWYDGYHFTRGTLPAAYENRSGRTGSEQDGGQNNEQNSMVTVFNPRSVMEAVRLRSFDSYWTQTASYEKLKLQIELNISGLRDQILLLASGASVPVDGMQFDNDLRDFKNTNEVLTALVHLGYLSYDAAAKTVRIPNKELRKEFFNTLANSSHEETARMIRMADDLLEATWHRDEEKVAAVLAAAHRATGDTKHYNSEARLSETVRLAYYTAVDHYVTIRELAGGQGFVDLAFIPKKGIDKPLLIVELKWDKPVSDALQQIRAKQYPEDLQHYGGEILLVGITYRVRGKKHICKIEKLQ